MAADGSGNIWVAEGTQNNSAVCKMPPYGGVSSLQVATCYFGAGTDLQALVNPSGIAVDGTGDIWAGSPGGSGGGGYLRAELDTGHPERSIWFLREFRQPQLGRARERRCRWGRQRLASVSRWNRDGVHRGSGTGDNTYCPGREQRKAQRKAVRYSASRNF